MGCVNSKEDSTGAVKTSKEIDRKLRQENSKIESEQLVKLLLLGPGEAGKSTILKQLTLLYGSGFTDQEVARFGETIRSNLITSFSILIRSMEVLKIPYGFDPTTVADMTDVKHGSDVHATSTNPGESSNSPEDSENMVASARKAGGNLSRTDSPSVRRRKESITKGILFGFSNKPEAKDNGGNKSSKVADSTLESKKTVGEGSDVADDDDDDLPPIRESIVARISDTIQVGAALIRGGSHSPKARKGSIASITQGIVFGFPKKTRDPVAAAAAKQFKSKKGNHSGPLAEIAKEILCQQLRFLENPDCVSKLTTFWEDSGVQYCFSRAHEYQMLDCCQ